MQRAEHPVTVGVKLHPVVLDDPAKRILVAAPCRIAELELLSGDIGRDGHLHQSRPAAPYKLIALCDESSEPRRSKKSGMRCARVNSVVHLELETGNLSRACAFYTRLLGWRAERIVVGDESYLALEMGVAIAGGVAECDGERSLWRPYVEVIDIAEMTAQAQALGAEVLLDPTEGPAGWRSVVAVPSGAQLALWQPKRAT